jgi:hypothetical protein
LSCEETPVYPLEEALLYKKLYKKSNNFWITLSKNNGPFITFIPAIGLNFIAWPAMIWYWTKTFLPPILSIPASLALLSYVIYSGDPYFYIFCGYIGFIIGTPLWFIMAQNNAFAYFEEQEALAQESDVWRPTVVYSEFFNPDSDE